MERNQSKRTYNTNFHKKYQTKDQRKIQKINATIEDKKVKEELKSKSTIKSMLSNIGRWFGFGKNVISLGESGTTIQKRTRSKKERRMRNEARHNRKANANRGKRRGKSNS